jgi:Family of unknown function (DUF6200)
MATTATPAPTPTEPHSHKDTGKSLIVVDLGEPQSPAQIRRLRKGKGKLFSHVERVVDDLVSAGTVKSNSQPVVIVVRELPSLWPFGELGDED